MRHPLYVGNILICAGFCLASGRAWSVALALGFLVLFYPPAIRHEDRKLRRLFPDQWDDWAAGTRALLPTAPSQRTSERSTWSFRQSLVANGEPIYVVVMSALLVVVGLRLS